MRTGGGGVLARAAPVPLLRKRNAWTALVAILAAFAPAPASAQIGRFLKKSLKEKIAQAVIENVVPAGTPVTVAPSAPAGWIDYKSQG